MARRALGPATLQSVQAVAASLAEADRSLLIACSGGADSLALAAAAHQVASRANLPCAAAVVDHGLQQGSAEVAARAVQQLHSLGIKDAQVLSVQVNSTGVGPEAAARTARYAALDEAAAERAATLLLGHTLDDQAETVLLGLARGSGLRSLAGMAIRSGRYLRPLLGLRRSTTEATCRELGLDYWVDPHNGDPAYTRSRLRTQVLPLLEAELGPKLAENLARTAILARADADLLDELAEAAEPITERLDCARLLKLARPLRSRVIRRWLLSRGASEANSVHVQAVDALVTAWHGQGPVAVPGLKVIREAGQLGAVAG